MPSCLRRSHILGIFSIFPAIFLTTMVALTLAQGVQVQAGAVGPMMLATTELKYLPRQQAPPSARRGAWARGGTVRPGRG